MDVLTLEWDKQGGLIPAVVQDADSGRVLMLGYLNREALRATLETRWVTFWSRSRQRLWTKGETSGNRLRLREIRPDCDGDALLLLAQPSGPTCHRGTISCFGGDRDWSGLEFVSELERLVAQRKASLPVGSYTTRLFQSGLAEIARKVGEEAVEVVVSALQERDRTIEESADLIFHLLVFLAQREVGLAEVVGELARRHGNVGKTSSDPGSDQ